MSKAVFEIKSLRDDVLKNFSGNYKPEVSRKLMTLRRERIVKPVIIVSTGTCGRASGALETLEAVEQYISRLNIEAEIIETGCNGYCSAAPVVSIQIPGKQRLCLSKVNKDVVEELFDSVFNGFSPQSNILGQHRMDKLDYWENVPYIEELPFFKSQNRRLMRLAGRTDPLNIEEYIAHGGYKALTKVVHHYTASELCNLIIDSGLRGRSGSGYLTGEKWKQAAAISSEQKYLICNAVESDPGAFMERHLIEGCPHKIIESVAIAAYSISAKQAFIVINPANKLVKERLEAALLQANEYGFTGENIFGSNYNLSIQLRSSGGALVCGEETALINSIEGKRGNPRTKPPYPSQSGLFGKPSVVNNIETLANITDIIINGPQWFKQTGTALSPGTKIFSVSGKSKRTGVVEVPMGISLREIIENIAGGVKNNKALKAVQIGGGLGYCLHPDQLDTAIDYEECKEAGFSMGNGGILLMDESVCMLDLAKMYMRYLHNESCGKCIPCREGTRRMLEILESITRRPGNASEHETLERFKGVVGLESLAEVIKQTSLCGLGQASPNPVLHTLKWFREEYEQHIFERKCKAGVCRELRLFVIDVDKCTGCVACVNKCPVSAIYGSALNPHFIAEDKCIGCGNCFDACKFSAIYFK